MDNGHVFVCCLQTDTNNSICSFDDMHKQALAVLLVFLVRLVQPFILIGNRNIASRILAMGEAYWEVAPELEGSPAQDTALKTHYGVGGNEEAIAGQAKIS